ncbi:hypothetical protein BX616_000481 [Lobosporangium transversale]|uniref:Thioredoxin n=1 Tax=Lobosporangium transversale TaxID=64571 RepID=A0A1Y2GYJ1_9FUNG|nr:thioredoxin-like protein [Lobosporangium transversale]KAF9907250.1 hypothetical protein BX616_000481 [Lobosporangium transversale]ORZ27359.1 thioredoxin-like protein [Lobosporangium transversale]|eukprot:XP_021885086.1 thioredoxin-like protein [Lobosporangium transversale]
MAESDKLQAFNDTLKESKHVVAYFTAPWCGPCKAIGPEFEKLVVEYPNIKFVKVDVDDQVEIAQEYGIRSMPTFIFFVGGQKVFDLVGAKTDLLKEGVARLASLQQ